MGWKHGQELWHLKLFYTNLSQAKLIIKLCLPSHLSKVWKEILNCYFSYENLLLHSDIFSSNLDFCWEFPNFSDNFPNNENILCLEQLLDFQSLLKTKKCHHLLDFFSLYYDRVIAQPSVKIIVSYLTHRLGMLQLNNEYFNI